jgi:hypothetical protein
LSSRTVVLSVGLANTKNATPSALVRQKSVLPELCLRRMWTSEIFVRVLMIVALLLLILINLLFFTTTFKPASGDHTT